jgi:hypothetical protein
MKIPLVNLDAQFAPSPWPPPDDVPSYTWLDVVVATLIVVMIAFLVYWLAVAVLNALDGV